MKFIVDKNCPPDTFYYLDRRYIYWGVPWWRRVWARLRGEWWAR